LFISNSESNRLKQILARLKNRSILTVRKTKNFANNGGMIRFIAERGKVRFRINNEAARAVRLTISSKLLRLADIVPAPRN